MRDADLLLKLEMLTNKLHRLVDEKNGNLLDPGVVAVSQELDILILRIQRNTFRNEKY